MDLENALTKWASQDMRWATSRKGHSYGVIQLTQLEVLPGLDHLHHIIVHLLPTANLAACGGQHVAALLHFLWQVGRRDGQPSVTVVAGAAAYAVCRAGENQLVCANSLPLEAGSP